MLQSTRVLQSLEIPLYGKLIALVFIEEVSGSDASEHLFVSIASKTTVHYVNCTGLEIFDFK